MTAIRLLTAEDWVPFSELRLAALEECPGMFGSLLEIEGRYTAEDWKESLSSEGRFMFGLFDGEELIGITGVVSDWSNAAAGYMIASYLKPAYRGRGLSAHFYQARLDRAVQYKAWKKVRLSHRDGNEPPRRANQRHGFVFVERRDKVWPDGTTGDELVYELDLETLRIQHGTAV